jgi:hypothetical protein
MPKKKYGTKGVLMSVLSLNCLNCSLICSFMVIYVFHVLEFSIEMVSHAYFALDLKIDFFNLQGFRRTPMLLILRQWCNHYKMALRK